jgi:hypothetical protein
MIQFDNENRDNVANFLKEKIEKTDSPVLQEKLISLNENF